MQLQVKLDNRSRGRLGDPSINAENTADASLVDGCSNAGGARENLDKK